MRTNNNSTNNYRSDRGDRELFDTVCSECGSDCQVPFKPSGKKPVLCSDCFRGNDRGSSRGGSRRSFQGGGSNHSEDFRRLNAKLDALTEKVDSLVAAME